MNNTTITAISTAPGTGGIAVIRISGEEALSICGKVFVPANSTIQFSSIEANKIYFG